MIRNRSPYVDPDMARYYAKASGPLQFQEPARDLVSFLQVSVGDTFLDIGSGTGLIAKAASEVSGSVTALDSSIEMLRQHQKAGIRRVVANAQELPFPPDTFDRIAAGFVITHLPDYRKGLRNWKRVLHPGGFLAATAWEAGTTKVSDIWKTTLRRYVDVTLVDLEFSRIIPSDEFFSIRGNLVDAFKESGFVCVIEDVKTYLVSMEIEQYIETKIGSVEGTIVRKQLEAEQWDRLVKELNGQLHVQFSDRIEYPRNVHFVLGQKPI